MMAVDTLAQKLGLLVEKGKIASSRMTDRDRSRLQALFETGALEVVRSGAGKTVVVRNQDAIAAFIQKTYPSGLEGRTDALTPRSKAVAELRDSKKTHQTSPPVILLRGFSSCILQSGKKVLPVAELTELAGVTALHLGYRDWEYTGALAVVENLEVFWHFEKLRTGAQMALYAGGRLSGLILDWLSSQSMAKARIIHCGDYDPVGLDEYLRLRNACSERAELFLPSNLEDLLSQYGKGELLQGANSVVLARLRKTEDQQVRRIVTMLDHHGVGLEQEILLMD